MQAYDLAISELDLAKLPSRIETANSAIELRVAELWNRTNLTGRSPEMESMIHALQMLHLLAEHGPLRKPTIA
jgi:hypothetical protein